MYNVYIKNGDEKIYIYRDVYIKDDTTIISPKLDLIESSAGTFSFKMPSTNKGYDILERLITEIVIERDNEEIWCGRALTIKEDFNKNRTITCEGELAYLNDTTQPQDIYEDTNLRNVLNTLLEIHNQKSNKKFYVGIIHEELNVNISEFITNYESTMKVINEKIMSLIDNAFLRLRKTNGVRYIDLIPDSSRDTSTQEIRFGKNMLDYSRSFDSTDFCTVVLPLGARIQDQYGISASGIEGVEAYTTAEDAPADNYHAANSLYVVNPETVNTFGWIEKVINYNDEENPEFLVEYAKKYLTDNQFDKMVLELNAVDLGYLDVDVQKIKLNEEVRAVSYPHGLDRYFPVKKISIPLDNPANTTFTMGTDVKVSLSTKTNTATNNIMNYINSSPTATSILEAAKRNAKDLISTNQTGYITITTDEKGTNELYITNSKIPENYNADNPPAGTNVTKYWRWNANGLEYVNRNVSESPRVAITIDGAIVADFITAGSLNADIIKAGTINADLIRTGILRGKSGNSYWDLNTGDFYMSSSTWDTSGYDITIMDSGVPSSKGYPALYYNGKYYLNRSNGGIYRSNGSSWILVKYASSLGSDVQSVIQKTANNISLKVSKGDLSSEISAESGQITISSNRLVIDSTNFKLSADGKMTCSDAEFLGTIMSGRGDQRLKIDNGWINYYNSSYDANNADSQNDDENFIYRIRPSGYGTTKYTSGIEFVGWHFLIDCTSLEVKNDMLGSYHTATKKDRSDWNFGTEYEGWEITNGIITNLGGLTRTIEYRDINNIGRKAYFVNGLLIKQT